MIDASTAPYEDNVATCQKVCEAAHAVNVSVEGALGTIGNTDSTETGANDILYTDPMQAKDFIEQTGLRLIIGKGGMLEKTTEACKKFGAIHCAYPGGCAVVAAQEVEELQGVEWMDLGMPEALWIMKVKEFGPLVVSIDTEGNNLFPLATDGTGAQKANIFSNYGLFKI